MGITSRRKGKAGEQELARLLRDHLGDGIVRNLMQSRSGGCDLIGLDGWSIEVKRAAKPRLTEWWTQALAQAQRQDCRPCLAYRLDRQQWRFVVALAHLLPGLEAQSLALEWTAEVSLPAFAALVRELLTFGQQRWLG